MKTFAWRGRCLSCWIALPAIFVAAGLPGKKTRGPDDQRAAVAKMKIYDALKIAVEALEERKLMYRSEYKLRAARVKDEWVFWFVFLPETPGLDVTVFVSDRSNIRILPGM